MMHLHFCGLSDHICSPDTTIACFVVPVSIFHQPMDQGNLLDAPSFETLKNPEMHSVHCLVDVPPCYESPFNILIPPTIGSEYYTRGYYMTDNELLLSEGRQLGQCGTCMGGSIEKGLRLQVTGIVQVSMENDSGDMMHMLTPTAVSLASEDQVECIGTVHVESITVAPSMDDTMNGTMAATDAETMGM